MKDFSKTQTLLSQNPMKDFLHIKDRGDHFFIKTIVIFLVMTLLIYATYQITVYKN